MKKIIVTRRPAIRKLLPIIEDLFGCTVFAYGNSYAIYCVPSDETKIIHLINALIG